MVLSKINIFKVFRKFSKVLCNQIIPPLYHDRGYFTSLLLVYMLSILAGARCENIGQCENSWWVIIHFNIIQPALLPNISILGQVWLGLVSIDFLTISWTVLQIVRGLFADIPFSLEHALISLCTVHVVLYCLAWLCMVL